MILQHLRMTLQGPGSLKHVNLPAHAKRVTQIASRQVDHDRKRHFEGAIMSFAKRSGSYRFLFIAALFTSLLAAAPSPPLLASTSGSIAIMYSGNVMGELEACG